MFFCLHFIAICKYLILIIQMFIKIVIFLNDIETYVLKKSCTIIWCMTHSWCMTNIYKMQKVTFVSHKKNFVVALASCYQDFIDNILVALLKTKTWLVNKAHLMSNLEINSHHLTLTFSFLRDVSHIQSTVFIQHEIWINQSPSDKHHITSIPFSLTAGRMKDRWTETITKHYF